ncbi:MAG: plastocyanin/azurin family copper-binding protein [Omnitrophica WOR_2 bacterium]
MKKHVLAIIALALVGLLVLSACGGGGGSSGGATNVTVTLTEFKFDPATVSVPAGAKVNLTLINNGSAQHSWVVMKQGTKVNGTFTDADKANIYFSQVVDAGKTVTATFTAPSTAGDYQIVCDLPGHLEAGMQGTLTVK